MESRFASFVNETGRDTYAQCSHTLQTLWQPMWEQHTLAFGVSLGLALPVSTWCTRKTHARNHRRVGIPVTHRCLFGHRVTFVGVWLRRGTSAAASLGSRVSSGLSGRASSSGRGTEIGWALGPDGLYLLYIKANIASTGSRAVTNRN
jgi:hypothetical protein